MIKSILIDATHFKAKSATGVENYVTALLPPLSGLLLAQGIKVSWVGHSVEKPASAPEKVEWVTSIHKPWWSQAALLRLLKKERPDLFFTPSGLAPLAYAGKTAITIHDMASYQLPAAYSFRQKLRLQNLAAHNARRAAIILTPSLYSKQQIMRCWKIEEKRIAVTPLAVLAPEVRAEPVPEVSTELPYFLFVGRVELKKNLMPVLEGFGQLLETQAARLVLAGKEGFGAKTVQTYINQMPEDKRKKIIQVGYMNEGQKEWLYQHAAAILVPSKGEGFGLPVLEAFQARVPAICAQAGALPEVGQDAVLFAHPDQSADWARQMTQALTEPATVTTLLERGTQYGTQYSWEKTARLTAEAFLNLI